MIRTSLLLAALLAANGAHAFGVQDLFQLLAHDRPHRAAFQEKKTLALLDKPVESAGELVFTPPGRLEKRTTRPRAESIVVEGDLATIERGGNRQTLRLSQYPNVAVFIDSIRSTLAGDLRTLTKTYSTAVAGDASRWRLTLRPLDPSLGSLVEHIEISGGDSQVRSVEIFQADGDRSLMTLTPLDK